MLGKCSKIDIFFQKNEQCVTQNVYVFQKMNFFFSKNGVFLLKNVFFEHLIPPIFRPLKNFEVVNF